MARSLNPYVGFAIPLKGEATMQGLNPTPDFLTLTEAAGISGKALVIETSAGTEVFEIGKDGKIIVTSNAAADDMLLLKGAASHTGKAVDVQNSSGTTQVYVKANGHINLKSYTTKVTTGLTKGDLFLVWHNTVPRLQIAIDSTAHKGIRFKTKTIGRLTA